MTERAMSALPVGERLWAVEAPLRFLGVQLGRRMAIVELPGQGLLIHSPARLTDDLRATLDLLGRVRFVVPASWLHGHLYMEHYSTVYPGIELFAAPGLRKRRRELAFAGDLDAQPDPRWAAELDQVLFRGQAVPPEVVFFHHASKTLIVGDLVWNVTPRMSSAARLWAAGEPESRQPRPFALRSATAPQRERPWTRCSPGTSTASSPATEKTVETGGRQALLDAYAWLR